MGAVLPPPPLEGIANFTKVFCDLMRGYRKLTSQDQAEDQWFDALYSMFEKEEFIEEVSDGIVKLKERSPYHRMAIKALLFEIDAINNRIENILNLPGGIPPQSSLLAKIEEGIRNGRTVIKSLKDVLKGIVPQWVMLMLTVLDEGAELIFRDKV